MNALENALIERDNEICDLTERLERKREEYNRQKNERDYFQRKCWELEEKNNELKDQLEQKTVIINQLLQAQRNDQGSSRSNNRPEEPALREADRQQLMIEEPDFDYPMGNDEEVEDQQQVGPESAVVEDPVDTDETDIMEEERYNHEDDSNIGDSENDMDAVQAEVSGTQQQDLTLWNKENDALERSKNSSIFKETYLPISILNRYIFNPHSFADLPHIVRLLPNLTSLILNSKLKASNPIWAKVYPMLEEEQKNLVALGVIRAGVWKKTPVVRVPILNDDSTSPSEVHCYTLQPTSHLGRPSSKSKVTKSNQTKRYELRKPRNQRYPSRSGKAATLPQKAQPEEKTNQLPQTSIRGYMGSQFSK